MNLGSRELLEFSDCCQTLQAEPGGTRSRDFSMLAPIGPTRQLQTPGHHTRVARGCVPVGRGWLGHWVFSEGTEEEKRTRVRHSLDGPVGAGAFCGRRVPCRSNNTQSPHPAGRQPLTHPRAGHTSTRPPPGPSLSSPDQLRGQAPRPPVRSGTGLPVAKPEWLFVL